jgi:hypothetical protein
VPIRWSWVTPGRCVERGRASVAVEQRAIREHVAEVETIAATRPPRQRRRASGRLRRRSKPHADAVCQVAVVMGAIVWELFGTPGV